jgi:serpin B
MYIILPDIGVNLQSFCASITAQGWQNWISQAQQNRGSIAIPKFRFSCEPNLKNALLQLGMGIAFTPEANFSGISPGIYISEARHKAYVGVDEDGTEAAAVTAMGFARALRPHQYGAPFEMIVDHPFLCAIVEARTGMIFFMGKVENP